MPLISTLLLNYCNWLIKRDLVTGLKDAKGISKYRNGGVAMCSIRSEVCGIIQVVTLMAISALRMHVSREKSEVLLSAMS